MGERRSGKGKGRVLDSMFRKRRQAHDLIWARKPNGELAYTAKEVGETARNKFKAHFDSRVSMEERWASWEHLMRGDTEGMQDPEKGFVAPLSSRSPFAQASTSISQANCSAPQTHSLVSPASVQASLHSCVSGSKYVHEIDHPTKSTLSVMSSK